MILNRLPMRRLKMARIKLALPESEKVYSSEMPLTINFINYGGHMGNDAILTICQEIRLRYMNSLKMSELSFHGKSLIQSDAAIVFKNEAFHGDVLTVDLYIEDQHKYGFDFFYLIKNSGKEIARAKTGMIFFDYEKRKVVLNPIA